MKKFKSSLLLIVLFAMAICPIGNVHAETGVLDSYFSRNSNNTNSSACDNSDCDSPCYESCRDYSAYVKPAIAIGAVAIVLAVVVLSRKGGGHSHQNSDFIVHAHSHS